MTRKWTDFQSLELVIMHMRTEGRTRQQIADALGLDRVQIKNWINRYNRRQTKLPTSPKRKGRQRKNPLNDQDEMAHKSVLRSMNKYGLLAQIRRRRKYRQISDQLHRYPNVLNRECTAVRPNQKWVTDISYLQTPQGTLYLSMIRDLFDNSIVAYIQETNSR